MVCGENLYAFIGVNVYGLFYHLQNDKITKNKGVLSEILIQGELTISQKCKYFLKQYGLLDEITSFFVDNLVFTRNKIAHGRKIYTNNVTWPVPPFFSLAQDSYEFLQPLKILTATMISCFAGLDHWRDKWREEQSYLLPSKDRFSAFLNEPTQLSILVTEQIYRENLEDIIWLAAFRYYTHDPKQFNIERLSNAMKKLYLYANVDENTAFYLFNISVVFCDSKDNDISEKAKENVKIIIDNGWDPWSNFKDVFGYLEHKNVTPIWYKDYLLKRLNIM